MTCPPHIPSQNPRHVAGDGFPLCVRCGRSYQPGRDTRWEWDATQRAALLLKQDAAEINQLAHARAGDGPVIVNGRDWIVEALEELADARNYVLWEMRGSPAKADLGWALAHVVQAYRFLGNARGRR